MKVKTRKILLELLERGVSNGYRRAFKHTDSPNELTIMENIMREITYELDDNFYFEPELDQL